VLGAIQFKIRIGSSVLLQTPVEKEKLTESSSLNPLQKLFGNDLVSIDVDTVEGGYNSGVFAKGFHRCSVPSCKSQVFPITDIDKMPGNRGCRSHDWADQVGSSSPPLPAFKISV